MNTCLPRLLPLAIATALALAAPIANAATTTPSAAPARAENPFLSQHGSEDHVGVAGGVDHVDPKTIGSDQGPMRDYGECDGSPGT